MKFPTPNNVKNVRAFFGLTGYYRRFAWDYAKTIISLYLVTIIQLLELLTERKKWNRNIIKHSSLPKIYLILTCFCFTLRVREHTYYILRTDVSNAAIGAVSNLRDANEEHRIIAYANRNLEGAKKIILRWRRKDWPLYTL